MNYQDFREKLKKMKKFPNCQSISRCPLVNPGFPGTFNLSYGEDPILKEYSRYQYFDHDHIFSTIQQVIRPNDLFNVLEKKPEKYLGIFEMSDVFGLIMLKEKANLKKINYLQIEAMINMLIELGIEKEDIFPKCCGGGSVKELTSGKYNFDMEIQNDKSSIDALISLGIPKENIRVDHSRDTLLSLNLSSGNIGWGYRTEIEVKFKNDLLDIGTTEIFMWDPIYKKGCIIGLKDISYTLAVSAVGVERLFTISNKLDDVREIPHIKKLYESLGEKSIEIEYLRTLHAIFTDKKKFNFNFGRHRNAMINKMIRKINISEEKIEELLKLNAEMQPWYPELKEGVALTISYMSKFRK